MPVNYEKTIFMKWDRDDFIVIGTFVHGLAAVPTSLKLKDEFERLHANDFYFFWAWRSSNRRRASSFIWIRIPSIRLRSSRSFIASS